MRKIAEAKPEAIYCEQCGMLHYPEGCDVARNNQQYLLPHVMQERFINANIKCSLWQRFLNLLSKWSKSGQI